MSKGSPPGRGDFDLSGASERAALGGKEEHAHICPNCDSLISFLFLRPVFTNFAIQCEGLEMKRKRAKGPVRKAAAYYQVLG